VYCAVSQIHPKWPHVGDEAGVVDGVDCVARSDYSNYLGHDNHCHCYCDWNANATPNDDQMS